MNRIIELYKKYKKVLTVIWGFISVFAVFWGFYTYNHPYNQNPELIIYQKSIAKVFEIQSENKDIKILYKDKDILKEKLNLKVFTFKIINNGKSDIAPNNFDIINEPLGFIIANGTIINAEIYNPSTKSLLNVQNREKSDSTHFMFKSFIFPSQQFFFVRMTILYANKKEPVVYKTGRIANAKIYYTNEDEVSLDWETLIIVIFLIIGLFLFPSTFDFVWNKTREFYSTSKNKKITKTYKLYFEGEPKYRDPIRNIYTELGKKTFKIFKESFVDKGAKLIQEGPYVIKTNLREYNCCIEESGVLVLKDDFIKEINQLAEFIG